MAKPDGRILARQNDERILTALHRFGWLRTRDLAALLWTSGKRRGRGFQLTLMLLPPTAMRMAQLTLARLTRMHKVNRIQAPDGSWLYGLAESGARQLGRLGIEAKSGKDLLRRVSLSHFHHRRLSNEVAILASLQGFDIVTEIEVASGKWFGGMKGIEGKKPDVLVIDAQSVVWVEIERSRRNNKDYAKLINWLTNLWPKTRHAYNPAPLSAGYELLRIMFVCDAAFIRRLKADLEKAGWDNDLICHRIQSIPVGYVTDTKFIQR